jgi:nucleotide-binding universal stress UspA family protein
MSVDQASPAGDRVVVGIDGSESSHHALRWARFLAQATGSTVEATAVWQPVIAYGLAGIGWAAAPRTPSDWNPAEEASKVLNDSLNEVFGEQRPPKLQLTVREGNAAQVLLEISKGATMLVVGSRGHGGFASLLLGSVSAACTEHATCPVLVVHGEAPPPPL